MKRLGKCMFQPHVSSRMICGKPATHTITASTGDVLEICDHHKSVFQAIHVPEESFAEIETEKPKGDSPDA